VIELTFADEDVEVLTAGDGEQAIARVQADRPDIVLADIGMPKRSGYDVAAFIKGRQDLSHIPVLLLTGAFEPVDEGRAQAAGCDGVLVKPFEPQHVIARVRELLRGAAAAKLATGSSTLAVADIPRPVERLASHRAAEDPTTHESTALVRGGATDAMAGSDFDFAAAPPRQAGVSDGALDDYFDRLDAAFANMTTAAPERKPEPVDPETLVHEPEVLPRHDGPVADKDLDVFDSPSHASRASAEQASPSAALPAPADTPATFANPPGTGGTYDWLPANMAKPQAPPIEPAELSPTISSTISPSISTATPPRSPAPAPAPAAPASSVADAFSALLAVEQGEPGATPVRLTTAAPAPVQITDDLIEEITRRVVERLGPGAVNNVVADVVAQVAERLVRDEIARIRKR